MLNLSERQAVTMHVTFNLNASFISPFITINAPAETPELQHLATNISQLTNSQLIAGIYPRGTRELVPVDQIIRIHTDAKHMVMETKATTYTLPQRIYQLKQLLPSDLFLQLSSGELVNRQHIRHFSLTPSGQSYSQLAPPHSSHDAACNKFERSF
ncbi:hypothetical protein GII22_05630 [Lactobacillus brevis]|nr:hypothetical protein [Levilactobacillus brevis]